MAYARKFYIRIKIWFWRSNLTLITSCNCCRNRKCLFFVLKALLSVTRLYYMTSFSTIFFKGIAFQIFIYREREATLVYTFCPPITAVLCSNKNSTLVEHEKQRIESSQRLFVKTQGFFFYLKDVIHSLLFFL